MSTERNVMTTGLLLMVLLVGFADAGEGQEDRQLEKKNWTVPGIEMEMRRIPSGTFQMGSPKDEIGRRSDETRHKVTITEPFYMGVYEVKQLEFYRAVMPDSYRFPDWRYKRGPMHAGASYHHRWHAVSGKLYQLTNEGVSEDYPMAPVSWHRAMAFCEVLNWNEWKAGRLPDGYIYRLPTEAEWEYACRAGTSTPYFFGSVGHPTHLENVVVTTPRGGNWTHAAGKTGVTDPNPWGLYEVHGNVYEWCLDWYGPYPDGAVKDPTGPSDGEERVARSGGAKYNKKPVNKHVNPFYRSASRHSFGPDNNYLITLGFRTALGPHLAEASYTQRDRNRVVRWLVVKQDRFQDLDRLREGAKADNDHVRRLALTALGERGGPKDGKKLIRMIRERTNPGDRAALLTAITTIGHRLDDPTSITKPLVNAVRQSNGTATRATMYTILAEVGGREAMKAAVEGEVLSDRVAPLLLKMLGANASLLREKATEALELTGVNEAALPQLKEALWHSDRRVRLYAVGALRRLGSKSAPATGELIEVVKNAEWQMKLEAVKALRAIGSDADEATPILMEVIKKGAKSLRREAVKAIGAIGSDAKEAVSLLVKYANGKNKKIQKTVQQAIENIKPENRVPEAHGVTVSCKEGRSVGLKLKGTFKDDTKVVRSTEIVREPEQGSLERMGPGSFRYRYSSNPGFTGQDAFAWVAGDGQDKSSPGVVKINVKPDQTPPKLLAVTPEQDGGAVRMSFNEPVHPDHGGRSANYVLQPGVSVQDVKLLEGGRNVLLTLSGKLEPENEYRLKITDIRDRAKANNELPSKTGTIRYEEIQRLEFDGEGNQMETELSADDLPENDRVTFEFWLFPKKSDFGTVIDGPSGGGNNRWDISSGNNGIRWSNHGSPSTHLSASVSTNEWQHIAITYDRGNGRAAIYVNGVLVAEDHNQSPFPLRGTVPIRFGPGHFSVSDIRIWKGLLSTKEIRKNMDRRLSGNEKNLIGHWPRP